MKKLLLLTLFTLSFISSKAQTAISAAGTAPDASAMLDVIATDKGFLAPRVALTTNSTTAAPVVSPVNGLLIFNTATVGDVTPGFYYWSTTAAAWQRLATGTGSTLFTAGTGLSWSGTTLNSVWTVSGANIYNNNAGNVGIGAAPGAYKLDVTGDTRTTGDFYGDVHVDDTRGVNDPPTTYNNEVAFDFKTRATIGVPGSGTYSGNMTIAPWGDNSGDASHQINFNEGGLYWRQGQPDAASWDAWSQILTTAPGGGGTPNYLARWITANTLGIGTSYDNGTNLGIGTTNPLGKLHVSTAVPTGIGALPANSVGIIENGAANNYITFRNTVDNGTYQGLQFQDNNVGGYIAFRNYVGSGANDGTNGDYMVYGTYTDHIFQTGASEAVNGKTEVVRMKQDGKVGIGTPSPSYKLVVQKTSPGIALMIGGSGGGPRIQTYGLDADGNAWMGLGTDMGGNPYEHSVYFSKGTSNNGRLTIGDYDGATYNTRVTVLQNGNVGIGATAPGALLQTGANFTNLNGRLLTSNQGGWAADGATPQVVISSNSASTNRAAVIGLDLHNDNTTNNVYAPFITFSRRSNSTAYNSAFAAIGAQVTGQGSDANWVAGDLTFSTENGTMNGLGERMRINQSGRVSILQNQGGDPYFAGLEDPTSAAGRAQLVLSSSYSDLVVASSEGNDNHGSTISMVTYNPANAANYRKWVINQGNWGARSQFLDFGYATDIPNPHSAINSGNTALTVDGTNRSVGIGGAVTPNGRLDVMMGNSDGIVIYQPTDDNMAIQGYLNGQWSNRTTYAGGCCNKLLLQPDIGEVGIRTTAPTAVLDVNGSMRIRSLGAGMVKSDGSGNLSIAGGGDVPAGSNNYIQNQWGGNQSANFHISGSGRAGADFRAPVFYDENNTAFFIDPNSNALLNKLRVDGNATTGGQWGHDPYGYGWGAPHGSFRSLEVSSSGNYSTEPAMFRIHQWGSGAAEFWKPQGTVLYLRETPGGGGGWFTRFVVQGQHLVTRGSIPNGWDLVDWGALTSLRSPGVNAMVNAHHGNSQLELVSNGPNTAHISFHRPGIFGANFGLDNDNWFSTQGWSAGGGYTSIRHGSFVAYGSGNITGGLVVSGTAYSAYGASARIYANNDNAGGGGIMVADDGGFFDYNDAWVEFRGSTGLSVRTDNGSWDMLFRMSTTNGGCCYDKRVATENNGWGLLGYSGNAWYHMWAYNIVNASTRESKRDITPVKDNVLAFVGDDLDKLTPYFYKYKVETDDYQEGNEPKYRPNMHMGLIVDDTPDYLLDNTFTGVDVYAAATMGIAGAKLNRQEIKEIKQAIGMDENTISISDFGKVSLSGTEMWVSFKDKFSKRIDPANLPVVTITANQPGVDISVIETSTSGFKVRCTGGANVILNYIAMADVALENNSKEQLKEIPADLMNGLRVDQNVKEKMLDYVKNVQVEKEEMERKAKIEGERIHQEKLKELSKPMGEPAKAAGELYPSEK